MAVFPAKWPYFVSRVLRTQSGTAVAQAEAVRREGDILRRMIVSGIAHGSGSGSGNAVGMMRVDIAVAGDIDVTEDLAGMVMATAMLGGRCLAL